MFSTICNINVAEARTDVLRRNALIYLKTQILPHSEHFVSGDERNQLVRYRTKTLFRDAYRYTERTNTVC